MTSKPHTVNLVVFAHLNPAGFRIQPSRACALMNEVWTVVRQWKQFFEAFGVSAKAIDQAALAMRHIDDVASPELKRKVLKAEQ